jgi:NAD(P)-dependent dehydrogenase (short-subunit alcohol dehydrogenase family)
VVGRDATRCANVATVPLALITGASTGIGRATALRLAAAGWTVLAGVREEAAGESLAAEAATGRISPLLLDVTDAAQVASAAQQLAEQRGASVGDGLDALVNNAGIGVGGPLEILPEEDLRRQFEVNVFGQVAVTRAMLPALRRARGRIAFLSSIGGRVALGFNAPYAASKHAVEAIGDALRVELHGSGVQVALIEPGSIATPIWEKGRGDTSRLEIPPHLQEVYGNVPAAMDKVLADTARRGIPPEAVAEAIERALTAKRMPARVLVGRDARAMLAAKRLLPARVFDRIVRARIGI